MPSNRIHFSTNAGSLVPMRAIAIALMLCAGSAVAQPKSDNAKGGEHGGQRRGPPPEALDACKAMKAGDPCSFTGKRGAVSGTCLSPSDRPLACRDKNAPPPPGGKPPGK